MVLDEPELPWHDPRLIRLRGLLIAAYGSSGEVRRLVSSIPGFDHDTINWSDNDGVRAIWTNVLNRAAGGGRARDLLDVVLADPGAVGFWPKIQAIVAELDSGSLASAQSDVSPAPVESRQLTALGSHRAKLDVILATVRDLPRDADLVRLLWAASADIGPIPISAFPDVTAVVELLDERMAGRGQVPAVLAFLEYLAVRLPEATEAIRETTVEAAHDLGVKLNHLTTVRARAEAADLAALDPIGVYVKIVRHDSGHLQPSVWLYRANTVASYKEELAACSSSEIRGLVERMITEFEPLLRGFDLDELRFEFVVPWIMLGDAVDQWQLSDGRAIGIRSQVVVRSLDRMLAPMLEAAWRKRSRYLRDCSRATPDQVVSLLAPEAVPGAGIVDQDQLACLVISQPYDPPGSWRDEHPVLDGLKDGLPVAVWYRRGGDPATLLSLLREVAANGGLAQIPAAVLRLRCEARACDLEHPNRHISLLWDDFEQQPERLPLRQPVTRGGRS